MSDSELIGNTAKAAAFLDTLGVNTKGGTYIDSYKNSSLMINSLKYLGIDSVRDSYAQYGQANPVLDAMAVAGIKFDFLVSPTLPAQGTAGLEGYLAALKTFQAEHPGAMISIEGLNEINLYGFGDDGEGSSTPTAAAAFQRDLYTAVKADPELSNVAVLNLTVGYDSALVYGAIGDLGQYSDYANAHAYPHTGRLTDDAMEYTMDLARDASTGDPLIITETGYTTLESTNGVGASELAQAKLILTNLFNAFENGSVKTYLYELFDTPTSEDRGDKEAHFGLFNEDGSPKLAADAIHNLTTILSFGDDGSSTAGDSLSYSFGNVPANTHSMVLEKSGGVHDIVVWTEKLVWNDVTEQDITNAPVNVTVNLGQVESVVRVYDPLKGLTPIATYENVSSFKIPLSDHPLIIEVGAADAVSEPVETVAPELTMTSAAFVAQMDSLANAAGLEKITLTDSNTLAVSSTATMNYMIAHYGDLLGKIAGGHDFSVTYDAATWRKVQAFDADGNLTSRTDYGLQDGEITSKTVFNADGSYDYYSYNIVGKSYTTEHQTIDPQGNVVALERLHADGTYDYQEQKPGDGTKHYVYYDTAGHKLNDVTIAADGTNTTLTYDPASGKLTRQMVRETDGDLFTTNYTNGVKTSYVSTLQNGEVDTITYDASGAVLTDVAKETDGSSTTKVYTAGVLTARYERHADGSQDNYVFQITGKSYETEHQTVNANGAVVALDRLHADGTYDYQEQKPGDGTKHYVYYDAAGRKLNDVTVAADGTNTTLTYDAASGALKRQMVLETDGDLFTTNYTNGVKTSYVSTLKSGEVDTITYNASGAVLTDVAKHIDGSTTTKVYTSGVVTSLYERHADGTQDNYAYHISGKTYVTEHQTVNANGVIIALERLHADGSYDYREEKPGDGTKHYVYYDTAGHKLNDVRVAADGTNTTLTYDPASGDLKRQMVLETDGDLFTTNYTNGVKTSYVSTLKNGDVDTVTYDASGQVLTDVTKYADGSRATENYTNGVLMSRYERHADGTQDNYTYQITGKSYETEHQTVDINGAIIALERLHADGTYDYQENRPSTGSKQYIYYDAAGHKLNDVMVATDGTNTTLTYDPVGGDLTRRMVLEADGDLFTTNYTNGVKTSYVSTLQNGEVDTITYNASGAVLTDVARHADGGRTTKNYTDGVLTSVYDKHADGSQDSYWYQITGKSYETEHQVANAAGAVTTIERLHGDGSYDYTEYRHSDGSREITNYTGAGKILNYSDIQVDGSRTVDNYLQDGSGDVRHDVYNNSMTLLQSNTKHADGTHAAYAYADSQLLQGGAGADTFYFRNMEDGRMHYDGGNDTVWNFDTTTINPEHLVIEASWATSFSDLHLAQQGNDVLISFDDHDSILLKYTSLSNVKADSFLFE